MLTGCRTYEIANEWGGSPPVNSIPAVVQIYKPPANPPHGKSQPVFVTDGIESATCTQGRLMRRPCSMACFLNMRAS